MWVARRAGGARSHPGKLDNMVAGGRDAGRTYAEVPAKECGEEAGIPEELALTAVSVGVVSLRHGCRRWRSQILAGGL